MPELLECQRDLAVALGDERESDRAMRWLAGDTTLTARRLAVYRGNVEAAATGALSAAYPVIRRVIGRARFDEMARHYLRRVPSASGDLHDLGAALADFLARDEDLRSLPYLRDLARLEWAAHGAYGAADAATLDLGALAELPVERQATIRFAWAAGTTFIESTFPIVRIWRIHQADFDGDFSVDWSTGEVALVAREGWRVAVQAVSAGEAAFMSASLGGAALGAAAGQALGVEPGFDLARLLARLTAANVICGFDNDEGSPP